MANSGEPLPDIEDKEASYQAIADYHRGHVEATNSGYFKLNKHTEQQLFQSANEILYNERKKSKGGFMSSNTD